MAIVSSYINNAVQQTLVSRIDYWEHKKSKIWSRVAQTSDGLVPRDWGQDWRLRKLFKVGIGGTVGVGQMQPNTVFLGTDSATNANFGILGVSAGEVGLNPNNSTTPQYYVYQQPLSKLKGLMTVEQELTRLEKVDATKAKVCEDTIEGTAEKLGIYKSNLFWAETDTLALRGGTYTATLEGAVLAKIQVTGADVTIADGAASAALTITGGSIARFEDALEVDVICSSGGSNDVMVRVNPADSPLFISGVDPLANALKLVNVTGGAVTLVGSTNSGITPNYVFLVPHKALDNQSWSATTAAATITLTANTTFVPQTAYGIERVLKGSGSLFGTSASHATASAASNSIDLSRYPKYRSYVYDAGGNALDETFLLQLTARLEQAGYNDEERPNEWWTNPGVSSGFIGAQDGLYVYQRNGQKVDINAGFSNAEGFEFQGFGGPCRLMTDRYIGEKKLYGTNNSDGKAFQQIQPPRMPGTKSGEGFMGAVEFLNPSRGYNDIWAPVRKVVSSVAYDSTLMGADFFMPYQLLPNSFRGMLVYNIGTSMAPVA